MSVKLTAPITPLPTRKVGTTDVVTIGYGAMSIGGNAFGEAGSDEERFEILDRLYELGATNWDTAHIYGDSEELIGKWFKRTGLRKEIFLATKFGLSQSDGSMGRVSSKTEDIKSQLAESLKKLQTDYIDLYYQHRTDPQIPIENVVKVVAEFVKEGKVKYFGLSDATVNTMRRAHKVHPVSAIQVEFSPVELGQEGPGSVIEAAKEIGAAVFAYSPTGRGATTGRYRSPEDFKGDFRQYIPKFGEKHFPKILELVDDLKKIGEKHHATSTQVAIAWVAAQGDNFFPIPGSKSIKYTDENVNAIKVKLSDAEVQEVRGLAVAIEKTMEGSTRFPEAIMGWSFVDTPELQS